MDPEFKCWNWVRKNLTDIQETIEETLRTSAIRSSPLGLDLFKRNLQNIGPYISDLFNRDLNKEVNEQYKKPLKWMGTQKQFAELIIELEEKGWVKNDNKSIFQNTKQYAYHFDLSETKKSKDKDSNQVKSLYQLLKPQQSKDFEYVKLYPQVYPTDRYMPCFNKIKQNEKLLRNKN